jgi:nucleoid DNA-binding protein
MEELITSYLVQKRECGLPLLGSFKIRQKPAAFDVAGKKISPPGDEIFFSEAGDYLPENLIDYISLTKKISLNDAEQKLHNWCLAEKTKLDSGQKLAFDSIGSLQKNDEGNIFFQRTNGIFFYQTLPAEKVIHKNDQHAMLVGDRETTSGAMNKFYRDDEIVAAKKPTWKMWALILFIISLLAVCYYFYNNDFSENTIGNQSSSPAASPSGTYSVPK